MAGCDLNEGDINPKSMDDSELWKVINVIFSSKSKNSASYKFGLMKAFIENLYNVNNELELTFDQIHYTVAKIYWNLVANHDLKQGPGRTALGNAILDFKNKKDIPKETPFDMLNDSYQLELIKKLQSGWQHNVYGALYGDTDGKIFGFNKKKKKVWFNSSALEFMRRHQRILVSFNNYNFAKYLEKVNEEKDSVYLISKVETFAKRTSLQYYLRILSEVDANECFYCGKPLAFGTTRAVHVDHFVPWSFVQADQLWNLVLSCQTCNSSKSDRLAESPLLFKVLDRNECLLNIGHEQAKKELDSYQHMKLENLYAFAKDNGYDQLWKPK